MKCENLNAQHITNSNLRHFLVLWKLIPPDKNFNLENFNRLRQTNSARIARRESFIKSVLAHCLGATSSARPARREWLLRQIWQDSLAWQTRRDFSARLPCSTTLTFQTDFHAMTFKEFHFTALKIRQFEYIWKELRAITNAIANVGFGNIIEALSPTQPFL